jgi:hypothetical protein
MQISHRTVSVGYSVFSNTRISFGPKLSHAVGCLGWCVVIIFVASTIRSFSSNAPRYNFPQLTTLIWLFFVQEQVPYSWFDMEKADQHCFDIRRFWHPSILTSADFSLWMTLDFSIWGFGIILVLGHTKMVDIVAGYSFLFGNAQDFPKFVLKIVNKLILFSCFFSSLRLFGIHFLYVEIFAHNSQSKCHYVQFI